LIFWPKGTTEGFISRKEREITLHPIGNGRFGEAGMMNDTAKTPKEYEVKTNAATLQASHRRDLFRGIE